MANGIARVCPGCGDPESEATGPIQPVSDDDPRELCVRCYTDEFGRSSVVKLYAFIAGAQGAPPETEEDAQRHALLTMVAPMASRFIPDDPDELDQMLLTLAHWSLSMRSDSAAPWSVAGAEPEQEVTSDENAPRDDPAQPAEGASEAPAIAGPDSAGSPPAAD